MSLHAPHTRSDQTWRHGGRPYRFQSTPLIRGATNSTKHNITPYSDFNPRPSYEERHDFFIAISAPAISIHAPHTRSDFYPDGTAHRFINFNPRPSYEERLPSGFFIIRLCSFQSTPLIRGATRQADFAGCTDAFQSTPLIRGATIQEDLKWQTSRFQSTPLIRGATPSW